MTTVKEAGDGITAEQMLAGKGLDESTFNLPIAIFYFFKGISDIKWWLEHSCRFNPTRINHPKLDDSHLHWGKVISSVPISIWNIENAGAPIVFVGPILFGPWCAIALEELRVFGLKYVVGIGAAGSFAEELQIGDFAVAEKAIVSDGASKAYTSDKEIFPSKRLLSLAEKYADSLGGRPKKTCVWQSDALYRETNEKRASWRAQGAECVNGDTSTLYSVSRALNIETVYLTWIIDSTVSGKWTGWGGLTEYGKDDKPPSAKQPSKSKLELLEDWGVNIARDLKNSL